MNRDAVWLYVDGGTTRTRVTAARGDEVLFRLVADVGARDGARAQGGGGVSPVAATIRGLLEEAARRCGEAPAGAVAAGMITSPQGLAEVPHVEAPAGAIELARGLRRFEADAWPVATWLVPGVRSGPARVDARDVLAADVMRGEEVLALGAAAETGHAGTVLSLGSHWKAIEVDDAGRVLGSVSTLSGELAHAACTSTILASGVPDVWPAEVDEAWTLAGAEAAHGVGLPRALYAVRLLELRADASARERFSFLLGAFVGTDRDTLLAPGPRRVWIAGGAGVSSAWRACLAATRSAAEVTVVDEETVGRWFRAGCRAVLRAAGVA